MTDHKLEAIANSALLRVLVALIVVVAVPLLGWTGSTVLARLGTIEASLSASRVNSATTELRLLAVERTLSETQANERKLGERVLVLEYQQLQIRSAPK